MNRIKTAATIVCVLFLFAFCMSGCQTKDASVDTGKTDSQVTGGRWKILADVPAPRFGGAGAVVNGKLHLFGGVNMNPHTPTGALLREP